MWIKGIILHPKVLLSVNETDLEIFTEFTRKNNLEVFLFSNTNKKEYTELVKELSKIIKINLITSNIINKKRGSYYWGDYILQTYNIDSNKLVYIGYDKYDWYTAIHSSIFYMHFSKENSPDDNYFFLQFDKFSDYIEFLNIFFSDPPLYTFQYDYENIFLRILFSINTKIPLQFNSTVVSLTDIFKSTQKYTIGNRLKWDARLFLLLLLIIQLWKEGLIKRTKKEKKTEPVYLGVYPSSKAKKYSPNIEPFINFLKGLTGSYYKEILFRNSDTIDKSLERYKARQENRKPNISYSQELETLEIGRNINTKIIKNIVVIDDFSTEGISFEAAKNKIIQNIKPNRLILAAIGKYGFKYKIFNSQMEQSDEILLKPCDECEEKLLNIINQFINYF